METAENIYHALNRAGVESVIDDRPDRAGVKFNDADLVGYPIRITVGAKGLAAGKVELYLRRKGETIMVPLDEVVETVKAMLQVMVN